MEQLFTGFRAVGKAGMRLRVLKGEGQCMGGDFTDQALADPQPRLVYRVLAQALGGEQFEHIAGTAQIDGTDFGDHFESDHPDDLIQAFLRRPRRRHDGSDPAEHAPGHGRDVGTPSPHDGRLLGRLSPWLGSRVLRVRLVVHWIKDPCPDLHARTARVRFPPGLAII